MPGRVIVLNGASSSGKTTLGRALQDRLDGVWLLVGIDTFIDTLPWQLYGTDEGHTIRSDGGVDIGAVFRDEQRRWREAMATLARAGSNVVIDEVFVRGGAEQAEWRDALAGLDVTWVGVRCDADVAAERELRRGDRRPGQAAWLATRVHEGVVYDVEIDTTATTPDDAAALVTLA